MDHAAHEQGILDSMEEQCLGNIQSMHCGVDGRSQSDFVNVANQYLEPVERVGAGQSRSLNQLRECLQVCQGPGISTLNQLSMCAGLARSWKKSL